MKKHITQAAIDAVALELKNMKAAQSMAQAAKQNDLEEYFAGKSFAIVEIFAIMTGQTWANACDMLWKRGRDLIDIPYQSQDAVVNCYNHCKGNGYI